METTMGKRHPHLNGEQRVGSQTSNGGGTVGSGSEYEGQPSLFSANSSVSPASSGTDEGSQAYTLGEGLHMQFACHACKISKVKCDKRHPCSRCQRLDLHCVAQNRSRGRPLKLHKVKSAPPRLNSSSSQGPPSDHQAGKGPPLKAPRGGRSEMMTVEDDGRGASDGAWIAGRGPAAAAGRSSSSSSSYEGSPPSSSSWSRNSHLYDVAAQAYLSHFTTLLNQGRLDHKRALCIVKTWMMYHHKHNVDLTRGISDAMLSHLGAYALGTSLFNTPQDPNYDDDETLHDPSGNYFDVRLIPSYISQLDDGISPFCGYIYQAGDFHVFSNARFAEAFMDAEEVKMHMMTAKVLPCFVWACFIVHSDDVRDMIMHLTDTFFTRPERGKELVHICRCRHRSGVVFMGLIRARWIVLNDGDYASLALNIIRLPASPFLRLPTTPPQQLAASAAAAPTQQQQPPPRQQLQQPSPRVRNSPDSSHNSTPSTSNTNSPRVSSNCFSGGIMAPSTEPPASSLPPMRRPALPPSSCAKPPLPPSYASASPAAHPSWAQQHPMHVAQQHQHMRRAPPPPGVGGYHSHHPAAASSSDPDEAPPPPSLTGWDSLDQIAGLEQQGVHEGDHAGDPVETYYALCNLVKDSWPNNTGGGSNGGQPGGGGGPVSGPPHHHHMQHPAMGMGGAPPEAATAMSRLQHHHHQQHHHHIHQPQQQQLQQHQHQPQQQLM